MGDYKVLRAFRMPRDGGLNVPHRIYEAGVDLTAEDMRAWDFDPERLAIEVGRLVDEGTIERAEPVPEPTALEHALAPLHSVGE